MGRKKRKAIDLEPDAEDDDALKAYIMPPAKEEPAVVPAVPAPAAAAPVAPNVVEPEQTAAPTSSNYAVTSHSAEIVGEDVYVSSGSEDEESDAAEVVLAGSRMGLMRRGLHHPSLVQPNRQWHRETVGEITKTNDEENEEKREQELAKLDPVERAKVLLAEKKRKLEEAEELARRIESEENAGRDPCLFSKRTAFDIRMDQIEDKPWNNGADITDYFNYTMTEADWLEYSQQQLQIRQELTDASRQRRPPDPNIVPVTPKIPLKQAPRVAVVVRDDADDAADGAAQTGDVEDGPSIGPAMVKKEEKMDEDKPGEDAKMEDVSDVGGGAWGAGAAPGSMLAKLIEEQERKNSEPPPYQPTPSEQGNADYYSNRGSGDYYGGEGGVQDQYSPPAPRGRGNFTPRGGIRGRGRGGYGPPGGNMPPPWAGRGHRGGFRGGYDDGYGGGSGHWR